MHLLSVPNISEGRRGVVVEGACDSLGSSGVRVLDAHTDAAHNRSVFTCWGEPSELVAASTALGTYCRDRIDLREHEGLHPRLGALDVLPFVPVEGHGSLPLAVRTARESAERLGELGVPSVLYGAADPHERPLPDLRRGGLRGLKDRVRSGEIVTMGPAIDDVTGVVCVGARNPLIAFNVWLESELTTAQEIARRVRASGGGLPGVRAIGLQVAEYETQVSMNLTDPGTTGIQEAFGAVRDLAIDLGARVIRTEIVGAPPSIYLPPEHAEAARLMSPPGRSLESLIRSD